MTFITTAVWPLAWSSIATWRAARNKNKTWFIITLTPILELGLLSTTKILYLCFFLKDIDNPIKIS
jgi:hypothetical protein